MDPWGSEIVEAAVDTKFEDDFKPEASFSKLEDSEIYIALLEKKLKSVRSKSKVVDNLSAYRADCIERLMRDGCTLDPVIGDEDQEKLLQE